jgi:CubicO group peptidase (beta-lactamase class C family)
MRIVRALLVSAAALAFLACSSSRVQIDFDHQADFSTYSTFAWFEATENDGPTQGPSQIVDGRIRRAIAENLQAKGLARVESGEADLTVTYYASLNSQMQFHTTGWGYGAGWGWGPHWGYGYGFWPGWSTTTVHTYHEGTIIIDIIDRVKNQLVWRGVSTRVLGKKSHSDEKIDQSMSRVFVDFPPGG